MEPNLLGKTLRDARKARNLTQAQLAEKSGVSQGTIGNIESGLRGYGESLVNIARALEVSPEKLRGEREIMGAEPHLQASPPLTSGTHKNNVATADEVIELISAYKEAAPKERAMILKSAKIAAQRASRRKTSENHS